MKSILIIGMGRFGINLAHKLTKLNNDVMVVDKNEEIIEELGNSFADSYIGDCRNKSVISALGVDNYDVCFVTIDDAFQSSLEVTYLLKEAGSRKLVSCAKSERQADLLKKIGADDVIDSEYEIATKTALRYNADNVFDIIPLNDEYSIFEIPIKPSWAGKSIVQVNVRQKYHVNIIAVKQGKELKQIPGASYNFEENDCLVVIGKANDIAKMTEID